MNTVRCLKSWPRQGLEVWLRDECKCVYCGTSLLTDRGACYFLSSYDHVLPVAKYKALGAETWNLVLACRPCNSYKGTFDPANDIQPIMHPIEENRDALIQRAKDYVEARRQSADASFAHEVELITSALRERDSATKGATASS